MISKEFLTAGKAIFTVDNGKGQHYTFKVNVKPAKPFEKSGVTFVSVMTGSDNQNDYTCIGRLVDGRFVISGMAKSLPHLYAKPAAVFEWALKAIDGLVTVPAGYDIRHAGQCCRCARMLTTPRSLEIGIGPECEKKMGLVA